MIRHIPQYRPLPAWHPGVLLYWTDRMGSDEAFPTGGHGDPVPGVVRDLELEEQKYWADLNATDDALSDEEFDKKYPHVGPYSSNGEPCAVCMRARVRRAGRVQRTTIASMIRKNGKTISTARALGVDVDDGSGVKHDANKPPYDLLPWDAIDDVVRVLQFGADKYAAHNWAKGMLYSRLIAASLRHITAWAMAPLRGEDGTDPESGISHLAHALCCLMFLLSISKRPNGASWDDRHRDNPQIRGLVG